MHYKYNSHPCKYMTQRNAPFPFAEGKLPSHEKKTCWCLPSFVFSPSLDNYHPGIML